MGHPNERQPPMTETLAVSEAASAAFYKAARVSLDDIRAAVTRISYFDGRGGDIECFNMPKEMAGRIERDLEVLTICLVTFRNGFTVVGKAAPVSAENYNRDHGRRLAYEDCIRQAWPLFGFSLRDQISAE